MSSLLVFPSHFNLFGQRNKNTENPIIETVLFLGSIAKEIMMIIFLAFSLMIFWLNLFSKCIMNHLGSYRLIHDRWCYFCENKNYSQKNNNKYINWKNDSKSSTEYFPDNNLVIHVI